ncbi:E3 ubiquitin-protein ligase BRE1A [Drosophila santomea]|uniref:E3 ubiquitin-protein ligase BRE1A n=1 Tax=Drosophila santomea TaxID=129105 RepID=UPI001953A211|nr:E3 ubiquitin-protein ligase BRE1A [Drosophila santomea]
MLETKSIAALAFEETPRKRKRETLYKNAPPPPNAQQQPPEKDAQDAAVVASTESCFTNAAFSSTPKKLMVARRRLAKENSHINPFPGLEVKSIADLAQQQQPMSTNPFEVLRQPPKKKKREHACFENPGLNLELPEKQFNPYEVVRLAATPAKGFVNPGLNLRGSDAPASLNPFEIHRPSEASEAACNPAGVANPALDEQLPTSLKIGLPFTPTLGCRIDFHGMSLTQLTPSKLLAEKLVFSPVPVPVGVAAPKRSLGAISEESSMDIGKELDRYQLELENSINEAKLRKNGVLLDREVTRHSLEVELPKNTKVSHSLVMETETQVVMNTQVDTQVERRLVCTRRSTLTEISEAPEVEEVEEDKEELLEKDPEAEEIREQERMLEQEMLSERERHSKREQQLEQEKLLERQRHLEREKLQEKLHEQLREKLQERAKHLEQEKLEEERLERQLQEEGEPVDGDVAYASESDDEPDDLDFKAPTRFVRAYRPAALPTKAASKESLHSIASTKSSKSAEVKPSGGMKGMIRKSIRRLMHPTAHTSPEKCEDKDGHGHGQGPHHNILNSIRHSLRRRPQKAAELEEQMEPVLADVSIVDTSERTMKLRSSVAQTEYMTIEQLTNEKKHSLRNSIRRSTRDVLRHVFHKSHDAYATAK